MSPEVSCLLRLQKRGEEINYGTGLHDVKGELDIKFAIVGISTWEKSMRRVWKLGLECAYKAEDRRRRDWTRDKQSLRLPRVLLRASILRTNIDKYNIRSKWHAHTFSIQFDGVLEASNNLISNLER